MKKIVTLIMVCVLMVSLLTSCSNVSASYADKVNKAASEKQHFTYSDVVEDLGDEAVSMVIGTAGYESGIIVAVKGVTTKDELEALVDSGEKVEGLIVVIAIGKATSAKYGVIDEDDIFFAKSVSASITI